MGHKALTHPEMAEVVVVVVVATYTVDQAEDY
jgi:hypothetical protein